MKDGGQKPCGRIIAELPDGVPDEKRGRGAGGEGGIKLAVPSVLGHAREPTNLAVGQPLWSFRTLSLPILATSAMEFAELGQARQPHPAGVCEPREPRMLKSLNELRFAMGAVSSSSKGASDSTGAWPTVKWSMVPSFQQFEHFPRLLLRAVAILPGRRGSHGDDGFGDLAGVVGLQVAAQDEESKEMFFPFSFCVGKLPWADRVVCWFELTPKVIARSCASNHGGGAWANCQNPSRLILVSSR